MLLIASTAGQDARVAIPAECRNLSDSGLYAIVPMGYGVAIGRRYIFELAAGESGMKPGSRQLVSQQGEVTRAELLFGENWHADHIGIGVRMTGSCSGLLSERTVLT